MVNEATKITLFGENGNGRAISYTCAAGKTISQGTLLVFVTDSTVSAHSGTGQPPAGVAAETKLGTDTGKTTISVWTDLEAGCIASETLILGAFVKLGAAPSLNTVVNCVDADITNSRNIVLGYTTTATAANSRARIRIRK